ncbi:O-antigen ligase family protein [Acinetobacter courvalinii]|uniref:O-antigen ligase family protein n=1 Tax=Acinetobacter courvalinii TaxID=280147 RepID=UPI0005194AF4|nr:O-antigen ligase domain-containing protein [Acinetobacter courvalinii]
MRENKMDFNKFNINLLAFFAFLLIFPLDYIAYTASSVVSFGFPIGFLGTLLSFTLIGVFFLNKKIKFSDIYMFGLLGGFVFFILLSQNSLAVDYFFWFKTVGIFFTGMILFDYFKQRNDVSIKYVIAFLFLIMSLLVLKYSSDGNYLRLSDAFVITSLFLISYQKRFFLTLITIGISCYALYLIGSRAGLMIYSLIAIILVYIKFGFMRFSIFIPPVIYILVMFIIELNSTIVRYGDNRFLRLIFDSEEDTSLNVRKELNEFGYNTFLQNPIVGDFGLYRKVYGEGAYAHNYLSFLSDFGIWGVVFLLVLIWLYIKFCILNFRDRTDYNIFIFSTSTFGIIGVAVAKSYYWLIPFFALGLLYRAISTKR